MLYTGNLEVEDTLFVRNEAVTEGLAILSLGGISNGAFTNVSLIENVFHCPASQYGYEEPIENPVRKFRFRTPTVEFGVYSRFYTGVARCTDVPASSSK